MAGAMRHFRKAAGGLEIAIGYSLKWRVVFRLDGDAATVNSIFGQGRRGLRLLYSLQFEPRQASRVRCRLAASHVLPGAYSIFGALFILACPTWCSPKFVGQRRHY